MSKSPTCVPSAAVVNSPVILSLPKSDPPTTAYVSEGTVDPFLINKSSALTSRGAFVISPLKPVG